MPKASTKPETSLASRSDAESASSPAHSRTPSKRKAGAAETVISSALISVLNAVVNHSPQVQEDTASATLLQDDKGTAPGVAPECVSPPRRAPVLPSFSNAATAPKKTLCPHGVSKYRCKDCGGSAVCDHGRLKYKCKDCGGNSVRCSACQNVSSVTLRADLSAQQNQVPMQRVQWQEHLRARTG